MNMIVLTWKNLISRPLSTGLSLMLLTLGVGMISMILMLSSRLEEQFQRNMSGIDMVVGAKGSPLQLILSAVFQVDAPTGNIPLEEVEKLKKNRFVASVIPLSYGDSYKGYRIVGTNTDYPALYEATTVKGTIWNSSMEVTVGARVAEVLDINVGDKLISSHGLAEVGEMHQDDAYEVVGVFDYSSSVIDQLILTSPESIWNVHTHEEGEEIEREVTAALVKFRNPMGMIQLPRMINQNTTMQAALPAYEINRLFGMMGVGFDALSVLAVVIVIVSGISLFINLYNTIRERKYELALLRTYGASPFQLLMLVMGEGFMLSISGFFMGIIFSRIGMLFLGSFVAKSYRYSLRPDLFTTQEILLLIFVIGIGIMASIIPAIRVFRIDISRTLTEG